MIGLSLGVKSRYMYTDLGGRAGDPPGQRLRVRVELVFEFRVRVRVRVRARVKVRVRHV